MSTQAPELDEAGEVVDSRTYYCPECGARYETPGVCTGVSVEAGHPEAKVEKVKGSSSSDTSTSSGSSGSTPRKTGSTRKTAATAKK